ncbi:MAG: hypothetical protein ABI893_13640, partial [Polaromonas sp.]
LRKALAQQLFKGISRVIYFLHFTRILRTALDLQGQHAAGKPALEVCRTGFLVSSGRFELLKGRARVENRILSTSSPR